MININLLPEDRKPYPQEVQLKNILAGLGIEYSPQVQLKNILAGLGIAFTLPISVPAILSYYVIKKLIEHHQKKPSVIEKKIKKKLFLEPQNPHHHVEAGDFYRSQEEGVKAEIHYRTALKLDGEPLDTVDALLGLSRYTDDEEKELQYILQANKLMPHLSAPRDRLLDFCFCFRVKESEEEVYQAAITLLGRHSFIGDVSHDRYMDYCEERGSLANAFDFYRAIMDEDPDAYRACFENVLKRLSWPKEAIEKELAKYTYSEEEGESKAKLEERLKGFDESVEKAEQIIGESPIDSEQLEDYALFLIDNMLPERYGFIERKLVELTRMAPWNTTLYFNLGYFHFAKYAPEEDKNLAEFLAEYKGRVSGKLDGTNAAIAFMSGKHHSILGGMEGIKNFFIAYEHPDFEHRRLEVYEIIAEYYFVADPGKAALALEEGLKATSEKAGEEIEKIRQTSDTRLKIEQIAEKIMPRNERLAVIMAAQELVKTGLFESYVCPRNPPCIDMGCFSKEANTLLNLIAGDMHLMDRARLIANLRKVREGGSDLTELGSMLLEEGSIDIGEIKIWPEDPAQLVKGLNALGLYDEAIEGINRFDQKGAEEYFLLADCYESKWRRGRNESDLQTARELYEEAGKLDPSNMNILVKRARIASYLGYHYELEGILEDALSISTETSPQLDAIKRCTGESDYAENKIDEALKEEDMEKRIEMLRRMNRQMPGVATAELSIAYGEYAPVLAEELKAGFG